MCGAKRRACEGKSESGACDKEDERHAITRVLDGDVLGYKERGVPKIKKIRWIV